MSRNGQKRIVYGEGLGSTTLITDYDHEGKNDYLRTFVRFVPFVVSDLLCRSRRPFKA